MSKDMAGSVMDMIKTPLGFALMLIILVILAGITAATAISGQLTAAAVRVRVLRLNHKCCWLHYNNCDSRCRACKNTLHAQIQPYWKIRTRLQLLVTSFSFLSRP